MNALFSSVVHWLVLELDASRDCRFAVKLALFGLFAVASLLDSCTSRFWWECGLGIEADCWDLD